MDLKSLLGLRPKDDTSAGLRAALAQAETELARERERVAELEAARGDVLLDGTPDKVARHEADLAAARAAAERLAALAAALPARIAAAEARERAVRLDEITAEAEQRSAAGAALLPEIVRAAEHLRALVEEHDAHAQAVRAANRELAAASRPKVAYPTGRVWATELQELAALPHADRLSSLRASLKEWLAALQYWARGAAG